MSRARALGGARRGAGGAAGGSGRNEPLATSVVHDGAADHARRSGTSTAAASIDAVAEAEQATRLLPKVRPVDVRSVVYRASRRGAPSSRVTGYTPANLLSILRRASSSASTPAPEKSAGTWSTNAPARMK